MALESILAACLIDWATLDNNAVAGFLGAFLRVGRFRGGRCGAIQGESHYHRSEPKSRGYGVDFVGDAPNATPRLPPCAYFGRIGPLK